MPTISSTTSPTTTPTTPTLPPPPSVKTVREVEALLKRAGFNPGKADGKVSPAFTSALKEFQTAWGLTANGQVDTRTLGKLRDTGKRVAAHAHQKDGYVSVGQKSGSIKTLEQRLARLGYDVGKADGIYSQQTADAVRKFKADQGELKKHAASGALSNKSRAVLKKEVAAVIHAPERARVRASKSLAALDARTTKAVSHGISEGAQSSVVKNLQKHLKAAGFDPQHFNGKFDERTAGAVKNFQRKAGLSVTGTVNGATWKALKIPGLILTWEHTSTALGSIYGHTAITLGDGHSSASDFIETNTLAGNATRRGLKIFVPIK
jgi:peptidoglycan hydrolase-like protein with peptidoglycan-binding domain